MHCGVCTFITFGNLLCSLCSGETEATKELRARIDSSTRGGAFIHAANDTVRALLRGTSTFASSGTLGSMTSPILSRISQSVTGAAAGAVQVRSLHENR